MPTGKSRCWTCTTRTVACDRSPVERAAGPEPGVDEDGEAVRAEDEVGFHAEGLQVRPFAFPPERGTAAPGGGVGEAALAGEELAELLHDHFGDLDLGFALGDVGDDDAVFVAPRGHHALAKRVFEEGEGVAGGRSEAVHGVRSVVTGKHPAAEGA